MNSELLPLKLQFVKLPGILGVLLLLAALRPLEARGAITLEGRVGFGQSALSASRFRMGNWTPVTIYLTGQGIRGVAQLTLTVRRAGHATNYTRKVSLREGPLNEAVGFVFDARSANTLFNGNGASPDLSAQLVMDGRELAKGRIALPLPISDETFNVLALTRDGSGMNFLTKKRLALIHRGVNPASLMNRFGSNGVQGTGYSAMQQVTSLSLLYTDPRALPGMAQGYAMVDAIVLADQPLDNLTEDQVSALQTYVRDGGLMIISGGGDLARLKSQLCQEMLPITPSKAVLIRENSPEAVTLEKRYQEPLGLHDPLALTAGTLRPGAYPLFGSTGGPTGFGLVAARPYGAGTVVFTAFDVLSNEFRGWKQSPALWRDILRSGDSSVSPRTVLAAQAHFGALNNNKVLADAMAGWQASNSPAWQIVALFLGSYLVLLVPGSYMLLKKLDKRELAWFTAPGLVLGFTVIAYLIALSMKGANLSVNRVAVLEAQANTDQVAGYGQMTIYSPRRAAYEVSFGGTGDAGRPYHTVAPAEIMETNEAAMGDLNVEHDQTTSIRGAEVRLWDKRSFDVPVPTTLGGPVSIATTEDAKGKIHVTVTNGTRFTLINCSLVNDKSEIVDVGTLRPGEQKVVSEGTTWAFKESSTQIHLPAAPSSWQFTQNKNNPRNESPDQVRNNLRYALVSAFLTNSNPYGNYQSYAYYSGGDETSVFGKASNAFVGWVDTSNQPLFNVLIDGKPAGGQEVAMLYVHLPPPPNLDDEAAKAANPFRQEPVLNLKDEAKSILGQVPGQ